MSSDERTLPFPWWEEWPLPPPLWGLLPSDTLERVSEGTRDAARDGDSSLPAQVPPLRADVVAGGTCRSSADDSRGSSDESGAEGWRDMAFMQKLFGMQRLDSRESAGQMRSSYSCVLNPLSRGYVSPPLEAR